MGLQVENDGGKKSTQKTVTIMTTPDYIPTINTSMLVHTSSKIGKPAAQQWGRVKNVADIFNEREDDDSDSNTDVTPEKRFSVKDIQKTAQLFIRSKKAVKRVRAKYSARAMRALQKGKSNSFLDLSEISGCSLDGSMFSNYSLAEVHQRIKHQKQIKLAVLQQKFLNELPALKELSVKDHLTRKLEALHKLKGSGYISDAVLTPTVIENPELESPRPDPGVRRQSRLRQSIDLSNSFQFPRNRPSQTEDFSNDDSLPNVSITAADVERVIALSKSRERIENDLNLPPNRIARLALLKSNVHKINGKFQKLVKGNKGEIDSKQSNGDEEEKKHYVPSRFTRNGMAIHFFRKYARIVIIVTQWINMIMNKQYDFEKELKSFVDIANEIEDQVISSTMHEFGLSFDKKFFKANKEISLSSDVRKILTTRWQSRTAAMVKQVMNGLQSLRSLSEYPVVTQEKLCKVAWYQTIGAKKAIVRQGHHAESFYFILSGTAFVKKMLQDPVTGEPKAQVAARLTKGHSFGEIGLLFDTLRTATVESATPMELLVIGKEDFVRIFMKAENPDDEPDHVKFLRTLSFMSTWPVEVLKLEAGACLTHYFKRGSLITDNDRHSEWIYIIMTGTCEVLKKLKAVKGRDPRELRPKSDPMADIILPELGMPYHHPKIDTGKVRTKRQSINPEVFQDMTDFYESLRRKYVSETPKPPPTLPPDEDDVMNMPDQADKQLPKIFIRSVSARKFSNVEMTPKVRFLDEKQKTDGDIYNQDIKLIPLKIPEDRKRPVSRARFDESTPKMQTEHFRLPSREKLNSLYRPTSRDTVKTIAPVSEDDVFLQVELLHSKESFGLNTLKYVMDEDDEVFDVEGGELTPILSLVSRGAEVIMLSKKVFLKYADDRCKLRVREQIKVYPPEQVMQDNMQLEADWSTYKENLLSTYIKNKQKNLIKPRCNSNVF